MEKPEEYSEGQQPNDESSGQAGLPSRLRDFALFLFFVLFVHRPPTSVKGWSQYSRCGFGAIRRPHRAHIS